MSGFRIFILAMATMAALPVWVIYFSLLREVWNGGREHGEVGAAVGITVGLAWMYLLASVVGVDA